MKSAPLQSCVDTLKSVELTPRVWCSPNQSSPAGTRVALTGVAVLADYPIRANGNAAITAPRKEPRSIFCILGCLPETQTEQTIGREPIVSDKRGALQIIYYSHRVRPITPELTRKRSMVRVHSGLPFQVAAPFSTCDSLPVFDYLLHQPRLIATAGRRGHGRTGSASVNRSRSHL